MTTMRSLDTTRTLLLVVMASSITLPQWTGAARRDYQRRGYGHHFNYKLYKNLMSMPRPGQKGAGFHEDQYVIAYKYNENNGCAPKNNFHNLFDSWREAEASCEVLECLPNNSTERRNSFVLRRHYCGPRGPELMPHLCRYVNNRVNPRRRQLAPRPPSKFPDCCPQFECDEDYDTRRLMLDENSPQQGRILNEVYRTAFSSDDVEDDDLQTGKDNTSLHIDPQLLPVITRPFQQLNFGSLSSSGLPFWQRDTAESTNEASKQSNDTADNTPFRTATSTGSIRTARRGPLTLQDILG